MKKNSEIAKNLKTAVKTCQGEYLAATLMLILVVLFGAGYLLFGPKSDFSEDENRALEPTPAVTGEKLLNGSFMKSMEDYVGDHFAMRKQFVELNTAVQLGLGKRDIGGNYAQNPAEGGVYFGKAGHIYEVLLPNRTDIFARNAAALGKLGENTDLPSYILAVPSGSQTQPDGLPPFAPNHDQREELLALQQAAGANTKVLDVFDALSEKNGDFYFKTDHHWNLEGAYLGYAALTRAMGIVPTPRADYEFEKVSSSFYGTLYSKAICAWQEPDDFYLPRYTGKEEVTQETGAESSVSLYWTEYLEKKDKYSAFLGGNHNVDVLRNGAVKNGRKLLLFKDSYANSMAPFLVSNFEEIHVLDLRYYKKDAFAYIKENGITEVAAVYSIKQLCDVLVAGQLTPRG